MVDYWLSRWIDRHSIRTLDDLSTALSSDRVVTDLRESAQEAITELSSPLEGSFSILAGRGIDLSGQFDCAANECRIRQVNDLFGSVWHYFDRVIVNDEIAEGITFGWERTHKRVKQDLSSYVAVILYLRAIGAEELVTFKIKPAACIAHWREHAKEAGLGDLVPRVRPLAERVASEAKFRFRSTQKGLAFTLEHKAFVVTQEGFLDSLEAKEIQGTREYRAAVISVRRAFAHLTSDVAASVQYGAPLGAVNELHTMMLGEVHKPSPSDLLMQLRLPVLTGLSTRELISLRKNEGEYFATFRDALVKAAKEKLKNSITESSFVLAEEIRLDIVEPQLNQIRAKLAAAQRVLTNKGHVGLFLGVLGTTCGLLMGLSPEGALASGTAVALSLTAAASTKHLDDLKDISLSDMFFLWKATQHGDH